METQKASESQGLIAACGLYCTNCSKYKKGKCVGCKENQKASWCKIRSCCIEKNIANCSDCEEYIHPQDCKKFDNVFATIIELFSGTDRSLCIDYLRKNSEINFTRMMNENGKMSLTKNKHPNK